MIFSANPIRNPRFEGAGGQEARGQGAGGQGDGQGGRVQGGRGSQGLTPKTQHTEGIGSKSD